MVKRGKVIEPSIEELYAQLAERLYKLPGSPTTNYLSQNHSLRAYDLLRDSHTNYQAHVRTSSMKLLTDSLGARPDINKTYVPEDKE